MKKEYKLVQSLLNKVKVKPPRIVEPTAKVLIIAGNVREFEEFLYVFDSKVVCKIFKTDRVYRFWTDKADYIYISGARGLKGCRGEVQFIGTAHLRNDYPELYDEARFMNLINKKERA